MIGNKFAVSFHVPGTLAANVPIYWTAQADCQLIHVSAVGSNANNGILDIGYTGTLEGYIANMDVGDSLTPAEAVRATFVGGEFPHIAKGTVIAINLDFDGAGGTAVHDFTLVLTFTEG